MYYVIYSVEVLEVFFNKLNTFIKEDRSERDSSSTWKSPRLNFANQFPFLLHEELVHGLGKRAEYFLRQFPRRYTFPEFVEHMTQMNLSFAYFQNLSVQYENCQSTKVCR